MAHVLQRIKAHYDVQEVEFGIAYRWCPESAVIECECGEELLLSASGTACSECSRDYKSIVEEVVEVRPEDKVDHRWRSLDPYYTPARGT